MTIYPLGITNVVPFTSYPPVGNAADVVGGTWVEAGNPLSGYGPAAPYVGITADITGLPAMPVPWVEPRLRIRVAGSWETDYIRYPGYEDYAASWVRQSVRVSTSPGPSFADIAEASMRIDYGDPSPVPLVQTIAGSSTSPGGTTTTSTEVPPVASWSLDYETSFVSWGGGPLYFRAHNLIGVAGIQGGPDDGKLLFRNNYHLSITALELILDGVPTRRPRTSVGMLLAN